jgi:phosphatidylserine/phosphatidylglycerophosphate/cardiolipin synthase-like enzyme
LGQRNNPPRRAALPCTSWSVSLNLLRTSVAAVHYLASLAPCCAEPAPVIHYAPGENLEHVDVALIDRPERELDMAAYVLTDWPVMLALTRAADRGVAIRIYLDGTQLAEREQAKAFNDLAERDSNALASPRHDRKQPLLAQCDNARACYRETVCGDWSCWE